MTDYVDAAQRIIDILGVPAARDLLRLLDADDGARADAFRQFYERGANDALLDC
jgi:hypothetical protein